MCNIVYLIHLFPLQHCGSLVVHNGRSQHTLQGKLDSSCRSGGAIISGKFTPSLPLLFFYFSCPFLDWFYTFFSVCFCFFSQDTLLRAVRQSKVYQPGGVQMNAPTHKWTYASAFLYSLTLITTIGEWASLVEPSFPPPLLLPLHLSGRMGEGRRLGQFISTRADVLRLPTAESCACVGAFETLTERLSAQLTGWLDDWMTSWPPPDRLLLLINKLSTWGGHGQRALGCGQGSSMPAAAAAASSYACCYFFLLLLLSFIFCCQHSLHTWQHFSIYEAARWFCNSSPQLTAETWLQAHTA